MKYAVLLTVCTLCLLPMACGEVHSDAWERISPSHQANNLTSVWSDSSSNVFAAGNGGAIQHYDGNNWISMDSGTTMHLFDIWGSSSTDVFTVGHRGIILHYNGNNWSSMDSGTTMGLSGIWGSSSTDVFAVGGGGTILHYNGSDWTSMDSGTTTNSFDSVGGSSATDVYAMGVYWDHTYHYNGDEWIEMDSPGIIQDIWGSSSSNLFAIDSSANILHYDGSQWTTIYIQPSRGGIICNASASIPIPDNDLTALWGSSASDVYVVGYMSTILHLSE